ncbi:MAG: PilN domain-containing protein [Acidobacteriota bacterium]|nr:PilN domain-containing protein [Acidobacteriota bacterium]MDW3229639.1 PilN domain-containing protein [Acidobacteriota bacterium]MDY0231704.1 PilN domain-containing protein [Candidatus Saccharicenans sp.]
MIRINLLKPEAKEVREPVPTGLPREAKERKKASIGTIIFLLLLVSLAGYYFYQHWEMQKEKELIAQAQQEKNQLQYVVAKLDELKMQKANLEMKINLITQLKNNQDIAVKIMDEINRRIPDFVWLQEASFDGQTLKIKGGAISNNLIADFITNLQRSETFGQVNLIDSTQRSQGGVVYLEFNMTVPVIKPELPAAKPVAPKATPQSTTRR